MSPSNSSTESAPKQASRPEARRGIPFQWLVAASFFAFVSLSLAQIFLIPPGEGFDEIGHYSYISLLADEGRIPVIGTDSMDMSWEQRRRGFPDPYDALGPRMTYRRFFEQPPDVRREAIAAWYGPPDEPVRFQQGIGSNWQGQHPPLYFALMVPVYKLAGGLSIGNRLLWLRLASVMIACSSVVFFWLALRTSRREIQRWLAFGVALAALTPSLVLDIARLGNDSLSMALAAALFWQLLALRTSKRPWLTVAVVGVLLGLGFLAKGYFPVLAPGVIVAVALVRRPHARWRTVLAQCALVGIICIAIAGWWHVRSYRITGLWLPTSIELLQRRASDAGVQPAAHLVELIRGSIVMAGTYFYCGTWSWVKIPWAWFLPFGVLLAVAAASFVRRLKSVFLRAWETSVLVILPLFVAGLIWHMWIIIRVYGYGTTPGYYLHVVWPFTALLLGGALVQLQRPWWRGDAPLRADAAMRADAALRADAVLRALAAAALVGCFVTARVGELAQLLIYGGVATKGPEGFLSMPDGTGLSSLGTALHNLGELVPLSAGLGFYALGVAAQVVVVVLVCRWLLTQEGPASDEVGRAS